MRFLAITLLIFVAACSAAKPSADSSDVMRSRQMVDQGVVLLRQGDLKRAEAAFLVAMEIDPGAAAIDGLGCVAMERGEYDLAESLFLRAFQFDQSYDHVLGNIALLYERAGLSAEAREHFEEAVRRNPENFQFRNNFAAFLNDTVYEGKKGTTAREELIKAALLSEHPYLARNLSALGGGKNESGIEIKEQQLN